MLRLLILFLILRGVAAASEEQELNSSGDDTDDDEDTADEVKPRHDENLGADKSTGDHANGVKPRRTEYAPDENLGADKSTGDDANGGGTLVIIIAAVSVAVLAIGSIVAIVLFRRYLQSREQGVYSVPAEQGQKAAV